MSGETDLEKLLALMEPELLNQEFVFCSSKNLDFHAAANFDPIASFREEEGLSLVLTKEAAEKAGFDNTSIFKCITLTVHSSLDAVGLTAAVAQRLAKHGISANVVAAYYHDHVFVPQRKAEEAFQLLRSFQSE